MRIGGEYVAGDNGKVVDNARHADRIVCVCNGYYYLKAGAQILSCDAMRARQLSTAASPMPQAAAALIHVPTVVNQ